MCCIRILFSIEINENVETKLQITDPYRGFEDLKSDYTQKYIEDSNKVSLQYLKKSDIYEKFKEKVTKFHDFKGHSAPVRHGKIYYSLENDGMQPHE